jgi:signal transduction histidine kinase
METDPLFPLLEQIRSFLAAVLVFELQTPLSTFAISLDTVLESSSTAQENQTSTVTIAMAELWQLSQSLDRFTAYSNRLWRMTLRALMVPTARETIDQVISMVNLPPCPTNSLTPLMDTIGNPLLVMLESTVEEFATGRTVVLNSQDIEQFEDNRQAFVSIINHELRTPLSSMQVCLESFQEQLTMPWDLQQDLLSQAQADANRLRSLLHDLTLLSRLQANQIRFQVEQMPLDLLLKSIVSSFVYDRRHQALPNIKIWSLPNLPTVWTDGDRLTEVVVRLLDNACRFTPPQGTVAVYASVAVPIDRKPHPHILEDNLVAVVRIADNGRGITQPQLQYIFNCFHQEEDFLSRTVGGAGIGLNICHHLMQGMGGEIWAESAGRSKGSRFYVSLPVF